MLTRQPQRDQDIIFYIHIYATSRNHLYNEQYWVTSCINTFQTSVSQNPGQVAQGRNKISKHNLPQCIHFILSLFLPSGMTKPIGRFPVCGGLMRSRMALRLPAMAGSRPFSSHANGIVKVDCNRPVVGARDRAVDCLYNAAFGRSAQIRFFQIELEADSFLLARFVSPVTMATQRLDSPSSRAEPR